jgi:hypothetical protein
MSSKRKIVNKRETRAWVRQLSGEIANPAHVSWFEGAVIQHLENSEYASDALSLTGKTSLPTLSRALFVFVPTYKFVSDDVFELKCKYIADWLSRVPESDPRLSANLNASSTFGFDDAVNRVRQEHRMLPSALSADQTAVDASSGRSVITDREGTRRWYRDGKLHREDGPATEHANGTKEWYLDGKKHREDGPAIENPDGTKFWYRSGQLHRDDGPAVEWADGSKFWYRDAELHREDGPAAEYPDGTKFWYLDGKRVTPEDVLGRTPSM